MAYVKQINVSNTAYDIRAKALGAAQLGSATRGIYLTSTGEPAVVGWYPVYCTIDGGNKANYPWHRFATCTTTTGQHQDYDAIIILRSRYHGGAFGIIKAMIRTNATNNGMNMDAVWLYRYGFAVNDICISPNAGTSGTSVTFNLYVKCPTYPRRIAYLMEGSNKGWSLINSAEANDTTTTDPKTSYEVFASVSNYKYAIDNASSPWVLKSGDDMTGTINMRYATAKGTNPSSTEYRRLTFLDNSGTADADRVGLIESKWESGGKTGLLLRAYSNKNENKYIGITCTYPTSGEPFVQVTGCTNIYNVVRNIWTGTTAPDDNDGSDGEVYIRYM